MANQDCTLVPKSHSSGKVKARPVEEGNFLAVYQGSTQINSAGIIFSSRAECPTDGVSSLEAASLSITSVRSESALVTHGGGVTEGGARIDNHAPIQNHVAKAASGYMMAHTCKSEQGEDLDSTPVAELPTPKELIEIRQRKKVRHSCIATLNWLYYPLACGNTHFKSHFQTSLTL